MPLLPWLNCTAEPCQDPMEAMAKVASDFRSQRIHWGFGDQETQEELLLTNREPVPMAAPTMALATMVT